VVSKNWPLSTKNALSSSFFITPKGSTRKIKNTIKAHIKKDRSVNKKISTNQTSTPTDLVKTVQDRHIVSIKVE